jgi:O-acetylhomoserine (thiol)-lyase
VSAATPPPDDAARDYGFDTRALHAGQRVDAVTGSRAVPIHQTAAYVFEDADHAADLFDLNRFGNIYTRIMNPTTAVFEERMASLEGGVGALATASGLAAQAIAITTLLDSGQHVVASRHLYGGSHNQLAVTLSRFGIATTFVDPADTDAWHEAVTPATRLLYGETIGNPRLDVLDIAAVAEVARDHGLPLLIDNTFATPYLCRPIEHGAHLVSHSATKWICGHGTTIGGALVDGGTFPWADGLFPGLVEPSPGYRGLRYAETFGNFAFIMKARVETMRDLGPVLSPFNSFLLLQGLETLSLRMDRHVDSARAVAEALRDHPGVSWVSYPGLPDSPEAERAARYLPRGPGAVVTFGVRGGREAGRRLIEACELCSHLANVGDAKTLIIHPASTTHRRLDEEGLAAAGVTDDMVRVSVGLETLDDIVWDLERAIRAATGA